MIQGELALPLTLISRPSLTCPYIDALPCLAPLPLLVDDLDDALLRALAAWPIRLYGVHNGKLERIGQPEGASFELQVRSECVERTTLCRIRSYTARWHATVHSLTHR